MVSKQSSVPTNNSLYNCYESSSDSDADYDEDGIDGYCVVKGKTVAYPVNADTDSDGKEIKIVIFFSIKYSEFLSSVEGTVVLRLILALIYNFT